MAGQRYPNAINNPGTNVRIDVPASDLKANVPIQFTAYPIGPAPNVPPTLDLILTPDANVPGFPSNVPIDFTGNGSPETLGFLNGFPAGVGAVVNVTSFANTGPFLLEVSAETPNNSSFSPEAQGIINSPRSINGFVGRSDTEDWYQFVAPPSGGTFTFNLSNLQDNADLRIFRQSGGTPALLNQGLNTGTANEALEVPLQQNETYLVQVSNLPNASNLSDAGATSTRYNLEIIPETQENPTDPITGQRVARYWDNIAGSHFFTSDPTEQQSTNVNTRFRPEGFEFLSEGDVTLRRYVNTQGGYFYASNPGEISFVETLQEWQASPSPEQIQVYSNPQPGTLPVFRAFNLGTNGHFYTIDPGQAAFADGLPDFRLEPGVAFYAKPA